MCPRIATARSVRGSYCPDVSALLCAHLLSWQTVKAPMCSRHADVCIALPGQADPGALHAAAGRQLLAAEDAAAALDYRCRQPIRAANMRHCAALLRTLAHCRRRFGRFTLRCSDTGATACSTSLAQILHGRCSAK